MITGCLCKNAYKCIGIYYSNSHVAQTYKFKPIIKDQIRNKRLLNEHANHYTSITIIFVDALNAREKNWVC